MPINKKKLSNVKEALKESRRCANSNCNNIIKDKRNTYCSVNCRLSDASFVNAIKVGNVVDPTKQWPEINELAELVKKVGFRQAAKELNVSDNGIRKRLKKFGILDKVNSEKPQNPGWFKKK